MDDIQGVIIDIYEEIKRICDSNGIRYFAIGGTCIGAVRHKGFIPWDDDLDIAIPNCDYYKFKKIAPDLLHNQYRLYDMVNLRHTQSSFMKVDNINTTFIENDEIDYPNTYKGVYVDIMPMFGAPDPGFERIVYCIKVALYLKFHEARNKQYKNVKGFRNKIIWLLEKMTWKRNDDRFWIKKWLKCVRKYDFDSSNYCGYVWSPNVYKLLFPKAWIGKMVDLPFENTIIKCPSEYKKYLKMQFGDYMHLPPEDKRVPKHEGIVDLNNPYNYYQKEKERKTK